MMWRIALWALYGAVVALFWAAAFYFLSPSFGWYPSQLTLLQYLSHSFMLALSLPLGLLGHHWAITWYSSVAINAATYAIVGLSVELARMAFRSGYLRLGH